MRRGTIWIVSAAAAAACAGLLAAAFFAQAPEAGAPAAAATSVASESEPAAPSPVSDTAAPLNAAPGGTPRDAGCVIVSLKRKPTESELSGLGLHAASNLHGDRLYTAAAPEGVSAAEFAQRLGASGLVEYAEPDYLLEPAVSQYAVTPNDHDFVDDTTWRFDGPGHPESNIHHAKSWGLRGTSSAGFDRVWPALANAKAGPGLAQEVRVAVIDTGFYFDEYADVPNNIRAAIDECATYTPKAARCTTDTDVAPADDRSADAPHGTMIASQIGQGTSNYWGSAGAAWDTRVDVYKVQGIADSTYGSVVRGTVVMPTSALAKAIYDAVDDAEAEGYRLVINLSLVERAGSTGTSTVRDAVAYARLPEHDAIIVAASGNDDASAVSYPAAYDGVIAVGASDVCLDEAGRAGFSNYGSKLDILAPGTHIWGPTTPGSMDPETQPDIGYRWWDGTSMASPYVASAAALLLRVEPSLTATEVETYLTRNAVDIGAPGRDDETGWGRLDAYAAYRALATPVTTADVKLAYAETATIVLSVSDRNSGDSVTTHYRLDGDDPVQERTVTVPREADLTHTLEYWSVDSNGVAETVHLAIFQVREADAVAPETSSDAAATYAGLATVHLTAHDPEPGWGSDYPITTHYRLDQGTDTTGTSLTVGSTGEHTLRFWSVDYAGNVETETIATFTVTPLPTTVTIARSPRSIRRGQHVHLSGKLTPARPGDTVTIQVKSPGSRTWRNFTGYSKYYRRGLTSIDINGLGTWSSLKYTLKKHGRCYFRAVYYGDDAGLSRQRHISNTVSVWVD